MNRGLSGLRRALTAAGLALVMAGPAMAGPCAGALAPPRLGTGDLTITYYGVSTLMISDGTERLLVDGFFSRPSGFQTLLTAIQSDEEAVTRGLGLNQPPVVGVLTAHAHHDHALDVATIAMAEPKAIVLGTPSVALLATTQGAPPERVCEAGREGQSVRLGAYTVTPFYTDHGSNPFFMRWILHHPLKNPPKTRGWVGSFKDNLNLSFLIAHGSRRILVHPSAGMANLADQKADIVFLGVGRLSRMRTHDPRTYAPAIVAKGTPTIVPIHWDGLTTALLDPLKPSPRLLDNVDKGIRMVCDFARSNGSQVISLDAGERLLLKANGEVVAQEHAIRPCPPQG